MALLRLSPALPDVRASKSWLASLFAHALRSHRAPGRESRISAWQTQRQFELDREPVKHKMQINS
jgi:hypothetical protein